MDAAVDAFRQRGIDASGGVLASQPFRARPFQPLGADRAFSPCFAQAARKADRHAAPRRDPWQA